jgi:hypothetical protein
MTDIRQVALEAERLDADEHCPGVTIVPIRKLHEWADEIERLQAENAAMRFALETADKIVQELRGRSVMSVILGTADKIVQELRGRSVMCARFRARRNGRAYAHRTS